MDGGAYLLWKSTIANFLNTSLKAARGSFSHKFCVIAVHAFFRLHLVRAQGSPKVQYAYRVKRGLLSKPFHLTLGSYT